MYDNYYAFGDYGFRSECELETFNSANEGIRWLNQYTKDGNFGGYSILEIASFAEDGEYIVHYRLELEYAF
jgi:hypothetical protein